jgi:photoactive yellow protein
MNKAYLLSLTQEEVDALPFGLITLDPEGTVVGYNQTEVALSGLDPQRVLGRNFFEQIAPCTRVKEFAGLYRDMVKSGETQSWEFNFVFRFATGDKRVHIQLAYFPEQQRGLIMVQSPSDS